MADNNKIQEEIIKADVKAVERLWKNSIQDNLLESLLEKMTKEELVKVAKKYSIKGLTSLKKADVVERIKNGILEKYEQALDVIDEDTLKFIEELIENNGQKLYSCNDIIYSNYLRNRGLVFTGTVDDELFVILPKELIELFKEKINKELYQKARLNREIIRAIAGMIYYYGVMDITSIKENLERVFVCEFDLGFIKTIALTGEELGYDYVVDEEVLYHIDVEDVEKLIKDQSLCQNDYYKFDKKSLIKAGEPDFIEENKQAEKLKKVFRELFGGGRAQIKYTDPDNILETGIDIDVQPPGKAVSNITLFSGGEKALIAISCLFAILKVRPVPMCILDEVEAALDMANVERFAKFLREFSKQTQFIVVTHREGTMEECDLLYGATMQQKGVTKLVSVKLEEAIDFSNENRKGGI
jgi:hypothetical protein